MSNRCDDNALLRYVLKLLSNEEAAEVRRHLAECSSCAAYLTTFENADEEPFAEEAASTAAVDDLLARSPDRWERLFAGNRDRYATPAAVQALIQACEIALDRDLVRADVLSLILTESADALQPSFASRTLQALAWTRRATALLRQGRLLDANAAVKTAEERASHIPAADYERALIAFTAADILRELGQTDEALRQIRDAAAVFRGYKDMRRWASAREMEAAVLFRSGDYRAAAELYLALLDACPPDLVVRGRLIANAAQSFVRLGEYERALPLFDRAEQIFLELGYDGYVTRILWGKARSIHALGDDETAIAALRDVWRQFERQPGLAEWIRVGVELVEWLLPQDAFVEARTICTAVYERATGAGVGMQLQALEAVTYLREAALTENLTADRAQYVRSFLEALPTAPRAEFRLPA